MSQSLVTLSGPALINKGEAKIFALKFGTLVYTAALGFAACHRRDARRYSSTAEGEVNRPRVYKNPSNALQVHVDKEDKTSTLIQGSGSNYKSKAVLINESGLYSLILSSCTQRNRPRV